MGQKLPGILFMKHLYMLVKIVQYFCKSEIFVIFHSIAFTIVSADIQVYICVNTSFLQLGNKIIQPIKLSGVQGTCVVASFDKEAA